MNNAEGSWLNLGWVHDGVVYFVLSGKDGTFNSSNPPVDWMQKSLRTLGKRPLSQICMPGTHDAGMGKITWADHIPDFIIDKFTQTQSYEISYQLHYGSRFLDIRPTISRGDFWTGHYSGKLGARGQSIATIIDDINNFTAENAELVIVNLSHALQTDDNFRYLNQDEWNRLMQAMLRLNHRYTLTDQSKAKDLSLLSLNEFIGQGKAAVICVVEAPPEIKIGDYAQQGFYFPSQLNVYNEYSNTNDCVKMVQDQLGKMKNHMSTDDKRLFLLSWTLTQQPPPTINVEDPDSWSKIVPWAEQLKSIRDMAYSANKAIMIQLLPVVGLSAFPNITYIDFMENSNYAALAMAINDRVFNN